MAVVPASMCEQSTVEMDSRQLYGGQKAIGRYIDVASGHSIALTFTQIHSGLVSHTIDKLSMFDMWDISEHARRFSHRNKHFLHDRP